MVSRTRAPVFCRDSISPLAARTFIPSRKAVRLTFIRSASNSSRGRPSPGSSSPFTINRPSSCTTWPCRLRMAMGLTRPFATRFVSGRTLEGGSGFRLGCEGGMIVRVLFVIHNYIIPDRAEPASPDNDDRCHDPTFAWPPLLQGRSAHEVDRMPSSLMLLHRTHY